MRPYLTRRQRDWLRAQVDKARREQIARAKHAQADYWASHPDQYQRRLAAFRRANDARKQRREAEREC